MVRHRALLLPLAVALAGLAMTYLLWQHEEENARRDLQTTFDFQLRETASRIEQRMAAYEQMLRGVQGFLDAAPEAGRPEFARYVASLQLEGHYGGIQGVGLIRLVPEAGRAELEQRMKSEGLYRFALRPPGQRPEYAPIVQIEPMMGRNLALTGYDTYADPVRRQALERARDSGNPALTGKLQLVSETPEDPQPGVVIYQPIYAPHLPRATMEERRAHLIGWAFAPFRMGDLMATLYGEQPPGLTLDINDGVALTPDTLLFTSGNEQASSRATRFVRREYLMIAGHPWTITLRAGDNFVTRFGRDRSSLMAFAGIGLSLLLALIGWQMQASRRLAMNLAEDMTRELRSSEERWKFALEGSGDGLWDHDLATGRVLYSPRCADMLGFAPEEIGDSLDEWTSRLHPEDAERAQAITQACIDGQTNSYSSEHRLRCKDGTWKWVLSRGMVVPPGRTGQTLAPHRHRVRHRRTQGGGGNGPSPGPPRPPHRPAQPGPVQRSAAPGPEPGPSGRPPAGGALSGPGWFQAGQRPFRPCCG